MAGQRDAERRSTVLLTSQVPARLPPSVQFSEVPNKVDPAVVVIAEHWEGGRIFARIPVSATDVHIFTVHAGNFVVILGNGRFRPKILSCQFSSYPNH